MARVRRPRYLCFFCNDQPFPDVERLLSGEVAASTLRQLYALSILTGEEVPLNGEELEYLLSTPSDRWVEAGGLEESSVLRLDEHGVLLSDDGDERLAALRRRDEQLAETQWNLYGALYFFLTRWSHVDLRVLSGQDETGDLLAPTGEIIRSFLEAYGDPPAPFRPAPNGAVRVDLPVVNQDGGVLRRAGSKADDAPVRDRRSAADRGALRRPPLRVRLPRLCPPVRAGDDAQAHEPVRGRAPPRRGLPAGPRTSRASSPASTTTTPRDHALELRAG